MTLRTMNTLESGEVRRYHCTPSVTPQTNAHHSWGVAVIAMHILGEAISYNLLRECLLHDTGELLTGDMPARAKTENPDLKEFIHQAEENAREDHMMLRHQLSLRESAALKMSDLLEAFIWCSKEEKIGANSFKGVNRGQAYIRTMARYVAARETYNDFLNPEEWTRSDLLFSSFGGTFPAEYINSLSKSYHE